MVEYTKEGIEIMEEYYTCTGEMTYIKRLAFDEAGSIVTVREEESTLLGCERFMIEEVATGKIVIETDKVSEFQEHYDECLKKAQAMAWFKDNATAGGKNTEQLTRKVGEADA